MLLQSLLLKPVAAVNDVRIHAPNRLLAKVPGVRVRESHQKVRLERVGSDEHKVLIWQRPILTRPASFDQLRKLLDRGYLIVVDFDDDPRRWQAIVDNDFLTFRGVHCIQTSTPALGEYLKQFNPHVAVFQNQLPELPAPPEYDDRAPVTLFFGALNRERDWEPILPALNRVVRDYGGQVKVQVVHDRGLFEALETREKAFTPTCPYDQFQALLGQSDIALLPLADTQFNRFKSDLKYLECAAHGATALASPTVYDQTIVDGENGLIFHDPDQFEGHLRHLLDDAGFRRRLAGNAYRYVAEKRLLSQHIQERLEWYTAMLEKLPRLTDELYQRMPILRGRAAPRPSVTGGDAAIWYAPDGYDTSRKTLMGRHAAGEAFLKAFATDPDQKTLTCCAVSKTHYQDFAERTDRLEGGKKPTRWLKPEDHRGVAELGTIYYPSPGLSQIAWTRRRGNQRDYSLCGVFHTTCTHRVMDSVADFLVAPYQPWDAVVCPSLSIKKTVEHVLDEWGEYLAARNGGRPAPGPRLPVIPLGVDCAGFAPGEAAATARQALRKHYGMGEDEVVVLLLGRLNYHAKAHPLPMYLGIEEAIRRTGAKVHLVHAGWFSNDSTARAFREASKTFCPSARHLFLDGRKPRIRGQVWHAADIFTSLSDNIQETFGLVPIEAMAAGLPVVVSDWDGYREAVRNGVDGFTIPTVQPAPGCGMELAERHESGRISYDRYVGGASQSTVVDVRACATAYAELFANRDLRLRMGAAGRERVLRHYDWPKVIGQYRELWRELAGIRRSAPETAPRQTGHPADPRRDDPYALFGHYPSRWLDEHTRVTLVSEAADGRLDSMCHADLMHVSPELRGGDRLARSLVGHLADGARTVSELHAASPDSDMATLIRAVGWLAKGGVVELKADTGPDDLPVYGGA